MLDFPNPVAHVRKVDNDYADVKVDTMGSEPIIVAPEGGTALFSVALTARPSLPVVSSTVQPLSRSNNPSRLFTSSMGLITLMITFGCDRFLASRS